MRHSLEPVGVRTHAFSDSTYARLNFSATLKADITFYTAPVARTRECELVIAIFFTFSNSCMAMFGTRAQCLIPGMNTARGGHIGSENSKEALSGSQYYFSFCVYHYGTQ